MKTETNIAKENVEGCGIKTNYLYGKDKLVCGYKFPDDSIFYCPECKAKQKEHLKSCQREKEFLENAWIKPKYSRENVYVSSFYIFDNRIKDLQGAIKEYKDGGVK